MANQIIEMSNEYLKVAVGQSIKQTIADLVNKNAKDKIKTSEIINEILSHPYLEFSEHQLAEKRYKAARSQKTLTILKNLKNLFRSQEIIQEIPQSAHGQTEITIEKINSGHQLQLLDYGENLILKIERHPYKNVKGPLIQYWLFVSQEKKLHLIPHIYPEVKVQLGSPLIFQNGIWQNPKDDLKIDFERLVLGKLGYSALKKLKENLEVKRSENLLDNLPKEVNDFCFEKFKVNINERELSEAQLRNGAYNEKYGKPLKNDISIDFSKTKLFGPTINLK